MLVTRRKQNPSIQLHPVPHLKQELYGLSLVAKIWRSNREGCVPRKTPDGVFIVDDAQWYAMPTQASDNAKSVKVTADDYGAADGLLSVPDWIFLCHMDSCEVFLEIFYPGCFWRLGVAM